MILTRKQQEGLNLCITRYNNKEAYTCIAGYAGTGKSTLVKFIIAALNLKPEEEVSYISFTGKAAKVLQQKGCPNAMTAHKLLYKFKLKSDGKYIREPKITLDNKNLKLIIVDEISMLPKDMWELLLYHKIPIICCGDPEQLPPINPDTNNHVLDKPHVFLDEIMRQAEESEIIRLSMHIREGKSLIDFNCKNEHIRILHPNEVVNGVYNWGNQIICSTNDKRNEINNKVRSLQNFDSTPQKQDKLISLHNHWDICSTSGIPLTNGTIGHIDEAWIEMMPLPRYISTDPIQILWTDIIADDGEVYKNLPIDYKMLITGKSTVTPKMAYQMRRGKRCPDPPLEFSYGYGITCHKAQGSEWDKVVIFEQNFPFDKEEHRRWLYTAITRASEKAVIIKK